MVNLMEGETENNNAHSVHGSIRKPREGWERAFQKIAECGEDKLLENLPIQSQWDEAEWDW